ncbi:histidine-containing phosphotransfer protein 2-like [Pyrus communis]|uniref:histidine-containing phosphotransfer protein 2-like n=1 Tax=Pyrus communis TaxID=23211 RepID=UPI0035C167B0
MAGTTPLTEQLNNFVRSLQEQGILDYHFDEMKELESQTPCLVIEALTMFLRDADAAIADLFRLLGAPLINYPKVTEIAYQLKGSSASIGGCRMADACCVLRNASVAFNKDGCFTGFDMVRREYLQLQESLNHILQMEHAIKAIEPRRRSQ